MAVTKDFLTLFLNWAYKFNYIKIIKLLFLKRYQEGEHRSQKPEEDTHYTYSELRAIIQPYELLGINKKKIKI